jgi:hypothetical protein
MPVAAAQKNDSKEEATYWMNFISCDEMQTRSLLHMT